MANCFVEVRVLPCQQMWVNWNRRVETNIDILDDGRESAARVLNGTQIGTTADAQGADATGELLTAALDNMAVDSRELVREDCLV